MTVEFQYNPREQFVDFHRRHQRNALMVCHRRMGKTVGCIGDLTVRALHTLKPDARYGYVAPFRQQAKEIAWVYLKNMTEGIRVEAPRESELRVKLPNDAWITLYGADNPDALRGLYFDGLILDVTATQFRGHPAVYVTDVRDHRYNAQHIGQHAKRALLRWTTAKGAARYQAPVLHARFVRDAAEEIALTAQPSCAA